jgi:Fe-S-cluster containining protein
MNDAEIINGLEDSIEFTCKKCQKDCKRTPCDMHFYKNIRDLIKHQQAEIEQLKFKNLALSQNRITMPERLEIVNNARDKAIREFAEKLKTNFAKLDYKTDTHRKTCDINFCDKTVNWVIHDVTSTEIDNLLKEMTGGADNV